jgi:DNA-binding transcriptional ArsR family regulator
LIFAALGDETRLLLVSRLCSGEAHSITQLTEGLNLTRQGITKHLRVLEAAGIVHGVRKGRENLFELDLQPLQDIQDYIERVSEEWDRRLSRLKSFVEG